MRKNRKMSTKMSVTVGRTVQIAAVMVMAFAVVMVNMLADSSCKHLEKRIREKEKQIKALEDEKERESGCWAAMTTPTKLEDALLKHGLSMHSPKPGTQVVRLNSKGQLYPAQLSVAKARERNRVSDVAKYVAPRPEVVQARPAPVQARPVAAKKGASAAQPRPQKQGASAPRGAAASARPAAARPAARVPARSTAAKGARR